MTDMGTFRIDVEVENPGRSGERRLFRQVLVDTGAELSVLPRHLLAELGITAYKAIRFRQADGTTFTRSIGRAFILAAGTATNDDVVLGEPDDLLLLGARTLEGLNVRIDPVSRQLVDAGPMPLAMARSLLDLSRSAPRATRAPA